MSYFWAIGYGLLAIGYRLLVPSPIAILGYWLLVIGYWLLIPSPIAYCLKSPTFLF